MISSNTEGNRYHDEEGKFASAPNSGAKTDNSGLKVDTVFKKKYYAIYAEIAIGNGSKWSEKRKSRTKSEIEGHDKYARRLSWQA